jgi:hypothetical protein
MGEEPTSVASFEQTLSLWMAWILSFAAGASMVPTTLLQVPRISAVPLSNKRAHVPTSNGSRDKIGGQQ